MPALLTSTSSRPSSASVRSTIAWTWASSATSVIEAIARPPRSAISRATRSSASPLVPATITAAPSTAKRSAMASPMPRPPPVTIATWSRSFTRGGWVLPAPRIAGLGIETELLVGLRHHAGGNLSLLEERRQGRRRDVLGVGLEEAAQVLARVAAAEAIGAQRHVGPRNPARHHVGHRAHVVG